jgi:hypothetical protein
MERRGIKKDCVPMLNYGLEVVMKLRRNGRGIIAY